VIIKIPVIWVLVLFLLSCSTKESKQDRVTPGFESLNVLKGAIVSGYIVDMQTGEVIASENAEIRMTPASLSKIFTSSAALSILGADFRYRTVIAKTGHVSNGNLLGDLMIIGGGDPTLGSKYFPSTVPEKVMKEIVSIIKKAGVSSVSGKLVIVSDFFDPPAYPSLRLWEDMSNYYGAPPSGLTFMDNTFKVTLRSPSVIGKKCSIVNIEPDVGIKPECRVLSSASENDSAYIYGFPGSKDWYIDGSMPAGRSRFVIKGAMPFPQKVFGRMLISYLKNNGIQVRSLAFGKSRQTVRYDTIGTLYSPPLADIVKLVNKKSINLFADHLFLTMAKHYGKADWDNARKVLDNFWKGKIGNNDIYLHDGSGLSPYNHCTAKDMVTVLRYDAKSSISRDFKSSLSVSGIDGTLKRIWNSAETKGKVAGKSGYMKGVLGYAGYITTKKNKRFAFCVIVNRFTGPVKEVRGLIEQEIENIIVQN